MTTTTGPTGTTVPRLARASRPGAASAVGETPADPTAGRTSAAGGQAAVVGGAGEGAALREAVARVLGGAGGVAAMEAVQAARERGEEPDPRPLYRLLGAERLLAASWPRACGGLGVPPLAAAEVVGALIAAGVPDTLHTLSVQICGNFLLRAGTHAQRATVLPALAAGTRFCTVLYSEPDVGSDLAALTTRAEPTGDGGWRLTGRKVYSVKTRYADLGLVAARTAETASRYQGITLFLVPLDAPGVTVGTLPSIADEDFADVRLSDVDVPAGAVVGPVGGAWPLITEALALERTGVDYVAKSHTWLTTWAHQQPTAPPGPAGPGWRAVEAGRLVVRTEAARALATRCVAALGAGTLDPVQAAATKLWCSETAAAVAWWTTEQAGPAGATGRLESAYREAPGLTLSAGTSEMMLELVAGSGLPAPDSDPAGSDEPLARQLRAAVRATATAYDDRDPHPAWWSDLSALGLFRLALPADRGGLPLGAAALTLACEELGRELHDAHLLDTLTTLDALTTCPAGGVAGRGVPSAALAGRWRAAVVGATGPGPSDVDGWLVVRQDPDGPVLSLGGPGRPVEAADELCRGPAAERVLTAGRLRRAAWLSGLAVGSLAHTVRRARTRQQFGRALIDNQSVSFTLGRLMVRYEAVRALIAARATAHDASPPGTGGDPVAVGADLAAGVLAEAGELALAATRTAMQVHGAAGMTAGSPVERHYRAAPGAVAADLPAPELFARAAATLRPGSQP